jgi:hypothetical protein
MGDDRVNTKPIEKFEMELLDMKRMMQTGFKEMTSRKKISNVLLTLQIKF